MPTRIRCSSPGSRAMQPLPALRMVRDLQAPEQIVDRLERAHRRFRLLAVAQHVVGDHARPRAGDEAADRRRRAHRDHLVGDALRQMLLQDLAALGDAASASMSTCAARSCACSCSERKMSIRFRPRRKRAVSGAAPPAISSATARGEGEEARQARILDCASSPGWSRRCGRAGARPDARTNRAPRARPGRRAAPRPACARSTGRKAPGSNESASSDSNRRVTSSMTCRSTGSLALASSAERCCSIRSLGVSVPERERFERRVAQQLVEPQQRLLELGAAPRRAVAAARLAGARRRLDGGAPFAGVGVRRRRLRRGMRASRPLERALARRLGDRTAEARSRRQHDGAIEARLRRPAIRAASTPPQRRSSAGRRQRRRRCAGRSRAGSARRRRRRRHPRARSRRRAVETDSTRRSRGSGRPASR